MLAMTLYNWILDAFLLDNNKPPSSFVGTYEDVFVPQRFDYDCVSGERYSYMLLLYGGLSLDAVQLSAEQRSAVQCSAVQCSAVQCSAVQCSAVQCSAVQCSAVQCRVMINAFMRVK